MGYITNFQLELIGDPQELDQFIHARVKVPSYGDFLIDGLLEEYNGKYHGSWKWYDYNEDMIDISLVWPDIIFVLQGNGEEKGDIWEYKYKNGSRVGGRAKIVYDYEDFPND